MIENNIFRNIQGVPKLSVRIVEECQTRQNETKTSMFQIVPVYLLINF